MISIICLGDGLGGADCVDPQGNKTHKLPSELINFWMTTEADEQNFSSWCYDTSQTTIKTGMVHLKESLR